MRGEEKVMALCDPEEEYAQLMTDFLKKHRELPWKIHTYTSVEELLKMETEELTLLVVAESAYSEKIEGLDALTTVVLNESGVMKWENVIYIDKYQQAEEVLKELLGIYMDSNDTRLPRLKKGCGTVFIGSYSPIHRSLQTSLALAMGQLLAERHTTLYLNFEFCAGLGTLLPDMQTYDMADLLYFMGAEKEKFRLRLQTICRRVGNLDFIPPMKSGQNLLSISAEDWQAFFQKIEELGEYEYVILDLGEGIQGLFDILRMCKTVYTIVKEDGMAQRKLLQYEQLLTICEYGDVLEKTRRLKLPFLQRMPDEPEQLTRGELAAVAGGLLKDIE